MVCARTAHREQCGANYVLATSSTPNLQIPIRWLYIFAALATASGVPWALTLLRRTNGALSIRSKRLAGTYDSPAAKSWGQPMCITYASHEKPSIERESQDANYRDTRALVGRWRWHNDLRTALLIAGTLVGAVAVSADR